MQFDPRIRTFTLASEMGPLTFAESDALFQKDPAQANEIDILRLLMSISKDGHNMRDIAMSMNRDITWWGRLTKMLDGIDMFFSAPACITAWCFMRDNNRQAAKDLVYNVLKNDNTYSLAVMLLKVLESPADLSTFTNADEDLKQKLFESQAEWDSHVNEWRAQSSWWKAQAE